MAPSNAMSIFLDNRLFLSGQISYHLHREHIYCGYSLYLLTDCNANYSLQWHHNGEMASQITSFPIVYSTVYSGADQRKHQSSESLAFVRGIHRSPVNSPHRGPVTRKRFPFDDVIMYNLVHMLVCYLTNPLTTVAIYWESNKISLAHNIHFSCQSVLYVCTVPYSLHNVHSDWTTEK